MEPVIVGAVAAVAISVVNGVVRIVQRHLSAQVERARITETGQTERMRCLAGHPTTRMPRLSPVPASDGRGGGDDRGGRAEY
ncbi:MAG TPA: hypothetical protein VFP69_01705 [Streptomyces sp.]|nr:hypothetical protein [Streptomyces sp.]